MAATSRQSGTVRPWRVAADFGTAWSKAALAAAHAPKATVRPLRLNVASEWDNPFLLASAVYVAKDRLHFGRAALEAALDQPNREALRSFKSVLSAPDLDRALDFAPKRAVDPDGAFVYRDLIVLYLAYLWASLERALAADPERPAPADCGLAFTLPFWPSAGRSATLVKELIASGGIAARALGPALFDPDGLEITRAKAALSAVDTRAPAPIVIDGCILEAAAAASCHVSGAGHVCVIDMGAGTTDFAGLRVGDDGAVQEISDARRTLTIAGDTLDAVVLSAIVKASGARSVADQSAVWRQAAGQVRRLKETVLNENKAVLRVGQRVISLPQAQVWKSAEAKSMLQSISKTFAESLDACVAAAAASGARRLSIVAAGGGAQLGPIREMLTRPKVKNRGVALTSPPAVPDWVRDARFQAELAPVFPQLAVAMGAAIAESGLIIPV